MGLPSRRPDHSIWPRIRAVMLDGHLEHEGDTVPHRVLVTRELAELLAVLGHPHRVRIVEELRDGECDVTSLRDTLGISHSGVSQHLMLLRAHGIVCERRQGRHVYYRLRQPGMASW